MAAWGGPDIICIDGDEKRQMLRAAKRQHLGRSKARIPFFSDEERKMLNIELSTLLNGFVKIVICNAYPLSNKTKQEFDLDSLSCLKYSMLWVRCAFGNVFSLCHKASQS